MRFMMTISTDKQPDVPSVTPELLAEIGQLTQEMASKGVLIESGGFISTARLHVADGKVKVTDGPFSEAKELVGGYSIVRAESKEQAIEMARQFLELHVRHLGPAFRADAEVRQLLEPSELGPQGQQ